MAALFRFAWQIDCVAAGFCPALNVKGYPTLKYFGADSKNDAVYKGVRTYDSLLHVRVDSLQYGCFKPCARVRVVISGAAA